MIRSLLQSHWSTTRLWMYTNTTALANDPFVSRLSKLSYGHINRLCSGHQHRRLVLRPDCQWCGFAVASTTETSVYRLTPPSLQRMNHQYKGHGHRLLAPRSTFDDRLVGVGLLNDSVVIFFWSLPHHTYSDGGDNKTMNGAYIRRWQNFIRFHNSY